ncbi:MAG TPA: cupin domain-containing protein [Candidatus Aminicenantes bacterium]|nr:cupin domain-containing protein [Candidatus Aminicenantes bacterium]
MSQAIFPPPVEALPLADIPLPGLTAYLAQGAGHQILFMEFAADAELPEHSHAGQWGIVLEGEIELTVAGVPATYRKGDRYFIPAGTPHSALIHAGYADITFFDQQDRYRTKPD